MTKTVGLLGYPIQHSRSPQLFQSIFRQAGVDGRYELFPYADVDPFIDYLKTRPDVVGFNITSPHKRHIIPYLDTLSEAAKAIDAVNVVAIERKPGRAPIMHGYNTDVEGFASLLNKVSETSPNLRNHRALVLGTGGAAEAALYVLLTKGMECSVASRAPKGVALALMKEKDFNKHIRVVDYNTVAKETLRDYSVLVQATPLGMTPHEDQSPTIPYKSITSGTLCLDLIYSPEETLFMRHCKEQGATVSNGLAMLQGQAHAAWKIWEDNFLAE